MPAVASILDADTWPPIVALFVGILGLLAYVFEPTPKELVFLWAPVTVLILALIVVIAVAVAALL